MKPKIKKVLGCGGPKVILNKRDKKALFKASINFESDILPILESKDKDSVALALGILDRIAADLSYRIKKSNRIKYSYFPSLWMTKETNESMNKFKKDAEYNLFLEKLNN